MTKKVVDPTYAKSEEYRKVIETIADEAKCPFCPDNFRFHKKPILKTEGVWFITESSWPYPDTAKHLLIISQEHKEFITELNSQDWASVKTLSDWATQEFKIKGGGLVLRFGDTNFTGATVCHLHFHLIVPKLDPQTQKAHTVSFPIG